MSNSDSKQLFLGLFAIVSIGLFVAAAVVFIYISILFLCVFAVYAVKTGRPLIHTKSVSLAVVLSIYNAICLTGAIAIGSYLLAQAARPELFAGLYNETFVGWRLNLDLWIVNDSIEFCVKLALVLFFSNRISVASSAIGWSWLSVIAPLFAMIVYSVIASKENVMILMFEPSIEIVGVIVNGTLNSLYESVDLIRLIFIDPIKAIEWVNNKVVSDWPNLFKIMQLYPTIFFVYIASLLLRNFIGFVQP